jgi:hypothetical protein
MAEKVIRQQPVSLDHIQQVTYLLYPGTGPLDFTYAYTPVDETGTPVGEKRILGGTKTGPEATVIRDWVTTNVLPSLNEHEGT